MNTVSRSGQRRPDQRRGRQAEQCDADARQPPMVQICRLPREPRIDRADQRTSSHADQRAARAAGRKVWWLRPA